MQSVSSYRTRLMELPAAQRFAACLQANARFTAVSVAESGRAKGDKRHFVSFLPASEARQQAILDASQDVRTQRAQEQGGNYLFVLDTTRRFFHCLNIGSGEVYETTERSCSCPDSQYRRQGQGQSLRCKHRVALTGGHSEVRGW